MCVRSLGASVPLSHPPSSGAHQEFQPQQVCSPGIRLPLHFPFLALCFHFFHLFLCLPFPHAPFPKLTSCSPCFLLRAFYFYLLPVLFGLLECFVPDSLPVIRGQNCLFPWWLRKNAVHFSLSPSRYLVLLLGRAVEAALAGACVLVVRGRQPAQAQPACSLFCCLTPGTLLNLGSSLRGMRWDLQLCVQPVPTWWEGEEGISHDPAALGLGIRAGRCPCAMGLWCHEGRSCSHQAQEPH